MVSATEASRVAVSVVTYNRPAYLKRCLSQISRQEVARGQELLVIVLDDSEQEMSLAEDMPFELVYEHTSRKSIGAKRSRALEIAKEKECFALVNWDDDDEYGPDRVSAQLDPLVRGVADVTFATPTWRWETENEATSAVSWPLAASILAAVDPDCYWGTELLDEAVASACFRLPVDVDYPDTSYDEDRVFLSALKRQGLYTFKRLPPGRPRYVHVKHADAASFGPLSRLYANNLGFLASPQVALPLAALSVFATSKALGVALLLLIGGGGAGRVGSHHF